MDNKHYVLGTFLLNPNMETRVLGGLATQLKISGINSGAWKFQPILKRSAFRCLGKSIPAPALSKSIRIIFWSDMEAQNGENP